MKKIKSLTLSLSEITDILSIDDPDVRRAAIEALEKAAADPEKIDLEEHLDGPPVILTLVHKVHRRAEAARKRAETRAKNRLGNPLPKNHAFETLFRGRKSSTGDTFEVKINESVVRRLLWIKQNLPIAVDTVKRILAAYEVQNEMARTLSQTLTDTYNSVTEYLRPLSEAATRYFNTPKHRRPTTIRIPAA